MPNRPRPIDRRRLPALVGALVLLLVLPNIPGAPVGGSSWTPAPEAPTAAGRLVVAPGFDAPRGARLLGPLPAESPVSVLVGLAGRDPSGLVARIALEETPGNPLYQQFLNAPELRASYGPTDATEAAAIGYFASQGLRATSSADGQFLQVNGPAGAVANAFHTTFARFAIGPRIVFAHSTPASLPTGVPWTGVLGLGNTTPVRPLVGATIPLGAVHPSASCPSSAPYLPCEVLRAYNGSSLAASGINGSGYRIDVVDAYDSSEPQTQLASDLAGFETENGLPHQNVSFVYPVPTSTNLNASAASGWGTEEALDLEWARGMAPGASVDMVLAPNASVTLYYAVDWIVAHDAADVISLSWGEPDVGIYDPSTPCYDQCNATTDGSYTLLHPVLQAAAAEGIGVFSATGDCGAAGGTLTDATDYPSSDPYVTAVGATVLATSAGSYSSESGWSGNSSGTCDNGGGSGGGFSPYPRPAWQSAPGFPANATGRGIPDVSLVGGPGQINITMYGEEFGVGGTSAGTPMWADLELLADQDLGHRLGSLDPSLYALARSGPYARYFHDVTSGNNGYNAGTGWDPVTGLGSPNIANLLPALTAPSPSNDGLGVQLYGTPRLGRAPLATTFTVVVRSGTPPVDFVDVGFGDGNATMVPDPSGHSGAIEVNHTFANPGVYAATATAVDSLGNSSTGPPIAIVVGGGRALNVSLNVSTTTPATGASVTLTASVANGTGPYDYSYFFGDGTYAIDASSSSLAHPYRFPGSFCAAVVVQDSGVPVNGGASARVGVAVGGAATPVCSSATPLTAQLSTAGAAADLPADFAFHVNTTGGIPPVSVQYTSDDPYVGACDCGIFSTPGNHEVRAFVNDSFAEEAQATTNVTLYPALTMNSQVSAMTGPAPLNLSFAVIPSGGHFTGLPTVNWSFGDGTTLKGYNESPWHVFGTPGVYTATVLLEDQGGGRASAAWVLNVTSPTYQGLRVGAHITPAVAVPAGSPLTFTANATGGAAPYLYRWNLGVNDSAFGSNVTQTYSALGCLGLGACPLTLGLTVVDAHGLTWTRTFQLPGALRGRASAVNFTDTGSIADGVTPYTVVASAAATGVLGLSVHWSFGDGTQWNGTTGRHIYYQPGNYTLTENAVDPYGDALVRTHTVVVTGVAIPPLVGNASANRTHGIGPLSVTFNTSVSGGSGSPYHVFWNFGDQSNFSGPADVAVPHTYPSGGQYEAVANLSDGRGDLISLPVTITVYDPTRTSVAVNATPNPITPSDAVAMSVHVTAVCTKFSVLGCSNGSMTLDLRVGAANGSYPQATVLQVGAQPNPLGWYNVSVGPFPGRSGMIWLWAVPNGPNYTGGAYAAVLIEGVLGPCSGTCGTHPLLSLPAWEAFDLLLGGVTGGAAVIALAVLWRRRIPPLGPGTGPDRDVSL